MTAMAMAAEAKMRIRMVIGRTKSYPGQRVTRVKCFVYHNSPETNNLDFFNSDITQTSCTSDLETTHGAQIHVSGHFQERAGGKL